jgi:hypothetical protein
MRGGCAKKFYLQYKGNAIYIGKMQERSPREKSSNACIESSLWTSSLDDYFLLESSLGISLWHAKNPILDGGRQESFISLFTFLFGKAIVSLEIQLP